MTRSRTLLGILALLMLAPAWPARASAQNAGACWCVNRDGNKVKGDSCIAVPDSRARIERIIEFQPSLKGRPRIGVSVENHTGRGARGARVVNVLKDGPADEAGIRAGDVITSIDGHALSGPLPENSEDDLGAEQTLPVQRLLDIVGDLDPGKEIKVVYLRDGKSRSATLATRDLGRWETGRFEEQMTERIRDLTERTEHTREEALERRERGARTDAPGGGAA